MIQDTFFRFIREGEVDGISSLLREDPSLADAELTEGFTAIELAVSCGWPEVVRVLLDHGADPNGGKTRAWNPLLQAAAFNDNEIARLLLAGGAEANVIACDESGRFCTSPLLMAAWSGNRELAELLLASGAEVNISDKWIGTPLHTVAERFDPDFVGLLIRYGADVNARDDCGDTPLIRASSVGDSEAVELLLSAGADVALRNDDGYSALFIAAVGTTKRLIKYPDEGGYSYAVIDDVSCEEHLPLDAYRGHMPAAEECIILDSESGRREVVRLLLDALHGVPISFFEAVAIGDLDSVREMLDQDPQLAGESDGADSLPLHYAAGLGRIGIAMRLLSHGADVNARDASGNTPLHIAGERGDLEMAKLLLSWGADVYARNSINSTPLHEAAPYPEVVRLLLRCGADFSQKDDDDDTPLHDALSSDSPESARLLVQHGADVNAEAYCGTPLMEALHIPEIVRLLLDHGADPWRRNKDGDSVLYLAIRSNCEEAVRILMEAFPDLASIFDLASMGKLEELTARLQSDLSLLYAGDPHRHNYTLLHYAAANSRLAVAEFLLDQGMDPSVRDDRGVTPLHLAAETDTNEVARLLVERGANVNARDNEWGFTPLHEASYHCNVETAKLLVAHGADVNAMNFQEDTPMAQSECNEIRRLLWRSGAK